MVAAFADTMDRKLLAFGGFFPYFLSERVVARVSKLWKRMQRTVELVRVREITPPHSHFPGGFWAKQLSENYAEIVEKFARYTEFGDVWFYLLLSTSPNLTKPLEIRGGMFMVQVYNAHRKQSGKPVQSVLLEVKNEKPKKKTSTICVCVCVLRCERWVCWKSTNTDNTYCVVVVLGFGEFYVFVRTTGRERPKRWVWVR